MLTFPKKYRERRRLKPVVTTLPRRLVRAFGPGEHYTFLQAKRAVSDLRLSKHAEPYAYAAACTFQELEKGNLPLSEGDYRRLRAVLVEVFDLHGPGFTVKDLLATPYAKHSPAPENANARMWASWVARSWGGAWGVSGAGLSAVSSLGSGDASDGGGGGDGD